VAGTQASKASGHIGHMISQRMPTNNGIAIIPAELPERDNCTTHHQPLRQDKN
jgi:hypothetical protein